MFFKSRNCVQIQTLLGFLCLLHLSSKINCQSNSKQGTRNETYKVLSQVLRNQMPPKLPTFCTGLDCPSCPICFESCEPCIPAFFSYCSMCHQRCRCRGPIIHMTTSATTTLISKSVFFKNAMRLIAKVHSLSEEINKYADLNSNRRTQLNVISKKNLEFGHLFPLVSVSSYTSVDNKTIKQHTDLVQATPKEPFSISPTQMRRLDVLAQRFKFSDLFNSQTTEKGFLENSEEVNDESYDEETSTEISYSSPNVTVTLEPSNTNLTTNVTGSSWLSASQFVPIVSNSVLIPSKSVSIASKLVPISSKSVPMRDSRRYLGEESATTLNFINSSVKLELKNSLNSEKDEPTKISIEEPTKDIFEPTIQLLNYLNKKDEIDGLKCRNVPPKDIQPIIMASGLKRPVLWQPYIVVCSVPQKHVNNQSSLYSKKRENHHIYKLQYQDLTNNSLSKIKELKDSEDNEIFQDNNDRVRKLWKMKSEIWAAKIKGIHLNKNNTSEKKVIKRMIVPKKKTKYYIQRKINQLSQVTLLKKNK